jgi:hypothetical protein
LILIWNPPVLLEFVLEENPEDFFGPVFSENPVFPARGS